MIGIDTVKIERIQKMHERFGDKAFSKFLSPTELQNLSKNVTSIAGYYAAKEAISKALGIGITQECGFMDIQIHKDEHNAPYFTLSKHLVEKFQITQTALSITHDGEYAIAVASIEGKKSERPLFH